MGHSELCSPRPVGLDLMLNQGFRRLSKSHGIVSRYTVTEWDTPPSPNRVPEREDEHGEGSCLEFPDLRLDVALSTLPRSSRNVYAT